MTKRKKEDSVSKKFINLYRPGEATLIPWTILRSPLIKPQVKTCYFLLLSYGWFGDCYPSQPTMGRLLGVSTRTIRKYLVELKKLGLVSWTQVGPAGTNLYILLDIPTDHKFYMEEVRRNIPTYVGTNIPTEVYGA